MVTETFTLHAMNGLIVWFQMHNGEGFDASGVVGSYPWDWIAADDKHVAKAAFALAVIGHGNGPVRYSLDAGTFKGDWIVRTLWYRVPSNETPVLGISSTWSGVVENLSPREREIAKLLPTYATKEIASILRISASTVETFRARIATKVGVGGGQLGAWCQAHHDIL